MMSVSDAAASGDHLKLLMAMRERIADAISDETCPPRDLSSLSRRLQDIAKEIDTLEERERREGTSGNSRAGSSSGFDPYDETG